MYKSLNFGSYKICRPKVTQAWGDGQIYECDLLACDQVSRSSVCASVDDIEHFCALSYHTPHVSYGTMKLHFIFKIHPFLI